MRPLLEKLSLAKVFIFVGGIKWLNKEKQMSKLLQRVYL